MFCDIKLSIHFGEDKTKSILLETKLKSKKAGKINIAYQEIDIKKKFQVTYLVCIPDETLSGIPAAYKTIQNFLFRETEHFWLHIYGGSHAPH